MEQTVTEFIQSVNSRKSPLFFEAKHEAFLECLELIEQIHTEMISGHEDFMEELKLRILTRIPAV